MKTIMIFAALGIWILAAVSVGSPKEKEKTGQQLFFEHCAACHVNGGNVINPQKTLHKKDLDLDANGLSKVSDLVNNMRNPGKGMPKFDEEKLPDSDARKIAKYVLKVFPSAPEREIGG